MVTIHLYFNNWKKMQHIWSHHFFQFKWFYLLLGTALLVFHWILSMIWFVVTLMVMMKNLIRLRKVSSHAKWVFGCWTDVRYQHLKIIMNWNFRQKCETINKQEFEIVRAIVATAVCILIGFLTDFSMMFWNKTPSKNKDVQKSLVRNCSTTSWYLESVCSLTLGRSSGGRWTI